MRQIYNHSGDNGVEDPPVPIPNTEVKLYCADSTCPLRAGRDERGIFKTALGLGCFAARDEQKQTSRVCGDRNGC